MNDFADTHLAGEFDERWDGWEDESDWEYAMQFDDREDDGWSERFAWDDDVYHDAQVLASAGWGTDEDYGFFGADYEPPF